MAYANPEDAKSLQAKPTMKRTRRRLRAQKKPTDEKNKEKIKAQRKKPTRKRRREVYKLIRARNLKSRYGISLHEYNLMFTEQKG